jgi:hypothetical protein
MKSDNLTVAISADPSPDVVLQALLAHDLMAFTEFAFGVVRPGILFKPNWHLEAVTYKLFQVAKGLVRRLIITVNAGELLQRLAGAKVQQGCKQKGP